RKYRGLSIKRWLRRHSASSTWKIRVRAVISRIARTFGVGRRRVSREPVTVDLLYNRIRTPIPLESQNGTPAKSRTRIRGRRSRRFPAVASRAGAVLRSISPDTARHRRPSPSGTTLKDSGRWGMPKGYATSLATDTYTLTCQNSQISSVFGRGYRGN